MNRSTQHANPRDEYETPQLLFDRVNAEFKFVCDVAASEANRKCGNSYTAENSALSDDPHHGWFASNWCNPPYSMKREFISKALEQMTRYMRTTVLLLPASTGEKWWHELAAQSFMVLLKGRVQFTINGRRRMRFTGNDFQIVTSSNTGPSCLAILSERYPPNTIVRWDWRKADWF